MQRAANQGDIDSQYRLGEMFESEERYNDACSSYGSAAGAGHNLARWRLGRLYEFERIAGAPYYLWDCAAQFYLAGSLSRSYECTNALSQMYLNGKLWTDPADGQRKPNPDEALRVVSQRVYNQRPEADCMALFGRMVQNGIGCRFDIQKGLIFIQKSASVGCGLGLANLGFCYQQGLGVEQNLHEACRLFEQASQLHCPEGHFRLAETIRGANLSVAKELYSKGARKLHPICCLRLAQLLQAENNNDKAVRVLREAADMNVSEGLCAYGRAIEEVNPAGAYSYYFKAYEKSYPEGIYCLGRCFELGIGVPVNLVSARDLYSQAANGRNANAYYMLGLWYLYGNPGAGIMRDPEGGRQRLQIAAELGSEDARRLLGGGVQPNLEQPQGAEPTPVGQGGEARDVAAGYVGARDGETGGGAARDGEAGGGAARDGETGGGAARDGKADMGPNVPIGTESDEANP
jgi:TPR repeat protein